MRNIQILVLISICLLINKHILGQSNKGSFSGSFRTVGQQYIKDTLIGADFNQYLHEKSSADAWLNLNYAVSGFDFRIRYDIFNNSQILNPNSSYTKHGIGMWNITKSVDRMTFKVGSIYDQFGSGLAFRAYEDRNLGVDYAIEGALAKYSAPSGFMVKAFTGRQKGNTNAETRFKTSNPVIRGLNMELMPKIIKKGTLILGTSFVNRTLDKDNMTLVADEISGYKNIDNKFDPKYNVYIYNGYTNLTKGNWNWNTEYNFKTKEAVRLLDNKLHNKNGNAFQTALSYSKRKLGKKKKGGVGINLQYKRLENFIVNVSPELRVYPLDGLLSYQPSITQQHSYRLLARYTSVVQSQGEEAIQIDIKIKPAKKWLISLNASQVNSLIGNGDTSGNAIKLYNEYYGMVMYKPSRKIKAKLGLQNIFFHKDRYFQKPGAPSVKALTPFGELFYKLNKKQSIRFETQYLSTKQDFGSFINAIIEFNDSRGFTLSVGDMVNIDPVRPQGSTISPKKLHYYNLFGSYNYKRSRFTLAYIKQLQGINCSGGVCRVEPAFSGVRFTIDTNF